MVVVVCNYTLKETTGVFVVESSATHVVMREIWNGIIYPLRRAKPLHTAEVVARVAVEHARVGVDGDDAAGGLVLKPAAEAAAERCSA